MFKILRKQVLNPPKQITNLNILNKPLGRWEKPKNKQSEDIKVLLANYDSCGDVLCGTPYTLKKDIDKILEK